ncbi:gibberellin receptor [Datura stramonium]|uniref:Gibberellin receptor n=1 Tax=Datura stramonium TaxID=4076 RepID=A0ABS8S6I5_DATST|nr:gibberellin receptor [Datura stramonium]
MKLLPTSPRVTPKRVVPLNTWILISNFKLAYNLLRCPDGTFNRHLAEFLDRKVRAPENRYPCAYDDGWTALEWVNSRQWLQSKKDLKVHIYLAGDSSGDRDWYWRAYLPEGSDRDHPACNPFGPNGIDLKGAKFPKNLVVVAGLDLVQDWQLAYADGLKKAGQEVQGVSGYWLYILIAVPVVIVILSSVSRYADLQLTFHVSLQNRGGKSGSDPSGNRAC